MSERLLTTAEVAARLGVSRQSLYENGRQRLKTLQARGLKVVTIASTRQGGRPQRRYVESSLDRAIQRAAERGYQLC